MPMPVLGKEYKGSIVNSTKGGRRKMPLLYSDTCALHAAKNMNGDGTRRPEREAGKTPDQPAEGRKTKHTKHKARASVPLSQSSRTAAYTIGV